MKHYGEGERVSSDTATQRFLLAPLTVSFHVRKSYMSNINFWNLSQNMYGKEKIFRPVILLESYIQHKCLL